MRPDFSREIYVDVRRSEIGGCARLCLDPLPGMPAMRPSSAAVAYSAVKDQLVSLSLEIEVREVKLLAT